jgi:NAD(P)-dependent dehydrogenase (short-subunit alcohol dehydrogenase family)
VSSPKSNEMTTPLRDTVLAVTGGAGGIGLAVARMAADRGAHVAVCDIDENRVARAVAMIRESGGDAVGVTGDVTSHDAVAENIRTIVAAFGRIDILVNNAAVASLAAPEDVTDDHWRREIDVCLTGTFFWSREVAVASMVPNRAGAIVNVGSGAAFAAIPGSVGYVTAKHGLLGMTKALALDWARHNIRVNCVCPGHTWTDLAKRIMESDPERMRGPLESIPFGDGAQPEDIAQAVLFLASTEASTVSGTTLNVDGAVLAMMPGYRAP